MIRRVGEARVRGPGDARDGGRVWAAGWGVGREGQGRAQTGRGLCGGMFGWVRVCCVVSSKPGGLEEKLAVFCGPGKELADEFAYLHLMVDGGKRVL